MQEAVTEEGRDMNPANSDRNPAQEGEGRDVPEATLRFTISNIDVVGAKVSRVFYVRNLPWELSIEPSGTNTVLYNFILKCNGAPQYSSWKCYAVAELTLLPQWNSDDTIIYSKNDVEPLTLKVRHLFSEGDREAAFIGVTPWSHILDPRRGLIRDNTILIKIHAVAEPPSFGEILNTETQEEVTEENRALAEKTFSFKIKRMYNIKGPYVTPEFYVRNLPWQIELHPVPHKTPVSLGYYLHCNGSTESSLWSCFVEAELCVLRQDGNGEPFTRKLQHTFNEENPNSGFHRFMPWKQLFDQSKGFVKHKDIKFEVHIKAHEPVINEVAYQLAGIEMNKALRETVFSHTIHNISEIKTPQISPVFYVGNFPWRIKVMQQISVGTIRRIKRRMSFLLLCCHKANESETWSCDVVAELRLLRQQEGGEPFKRKTQHLFRRDRACWGFSDFLPWHDLMDPGNGFVKDDSIVVEIHLKVTTLKNNMKSARENGTTGTKST